MDKYIRGGSWYSNARICRSDFRYAYNRNCRNYYIGLRVVCNEKKEEGWFAAMMKFIRGGSWYNKARNCRSANGSRYASTNRSNDLSLRAASSQPFVNLVYIPSGRFTMGSPASEAGRYSNEEQREVVIEQPFWMMDAPVTRRLYHVVMGLQFDGKNPDHPMTYITWHDSIEFCRRLSEQTGHQFTLPTEDQWEYACRAGTNTAFSFGDDFDMLNNYGWYYKNCKGLQPVKQKKPNPWGLYDMHGLVWEWCSDGPEG